MKTSFLLFFCCWLTTAGAFNVRDYGAKGDGVSDDTEAIQAAVLAFEAAISPTPHRLMHWDEPGGVRFHAHGEVVFPAGVYRITRPVVLGRYASLRGEGEAVIAMEGAEHELFYFDQNWLSWIEGLTFRGGGVQLRFWTNNQGPAQIAIHRCRFEQAASYALECQSYTKEVPTGEDQELETFQPWPPYRVDRSEPRRPRLLPNDPSGLVEWFNSTVFSVTECTFSQVMAVGDLQCDTTVFADCSVDLHPEADGPAFHFPSGMSHLYRVKAKANPAAGREPYWVEGGGVFSAHEVETQSGERGLDFFRISKAAKPISLSLGGVGVVIHKSRLQVAGSRHGAVCWIAKEAHPYYLSMTEVEETGGGDAVRAIAWEKEPESVAALAAFLPVEPQVALEEWFRITLAGNSEHLSEELPVGLKGLREEAIPPSVREATFVAPLPWRHDAIEAQAVAKLDARDFGLVNDPEKDQSKAVQALFDAAAAKGHALVSFPGWRVRLERPVTLPPSVSVVGRGMAHFVGRKGRDLFRVEGARTVSLRGLCFSGGREAISITTDGETPARVALTNLWLTDQSGPSVRCLASKRENDTHLLLHLGNYSAMQALVSNAARTQVDSVWLINDPRLDHRASIENLAGEMRVQSVLTNPKLWQGNRHKRPEHLADWALSRQTRWIDVHGKLFALDNRFGGESGGMCNVYVREAGALVYIGGGSSRFLNGETQPAILYMEQPAKLAVLEAISCVPVSADGNTALLPREAQEVYMSGVLAPDARRPLGETAER